MSQPPLSRVKRDRMRKLEKEKELAALRSALPVLTKDEIRKYRMPYHQAIQEELTEKGFINSSEFIRQLLDYQKKFKESHSYDFVVQTRPWLFESKENLERLSKGLVKAEENHFNGNINGELDELLSLAYYYGFGSSDWWWLSDQIFEQCLEISADHAVDHGFRKSEIRYIFGKYLIEQDLNSGRGFDLLNAARNISEGFIWTASKITKRQEKTIFVETCTILYNFLIKQIRGLYLLHPEEALDLCTIAKKRGVDACIPKADILFLQGRCEMEANKPQLAVDSFRKAQLLYKNLNLIPEFCEGRIFLALAFLECGEWEKAYTELMKLLEFAEKEKIHKYVALSYTYIGLYYLNQGTAEMATPVLEQAMDIFHELNDVSNREFVKNLACISTGQETIERYTNLILACEMKNQEKNRRNLLRLVLWKDMRVSFTEDISLPSMSIGEEEEEECEGNLVDNIVLEGKIEEEDSEKDEEIRVHNLNV